MTRASSPTKIGAGAVVLVALLSFGACGDDNGAETGSKASFIAQGEELCGELKEDIGTLFRDFAFTLPRRVASYTKVLKQARAFSKRFAALKPPADGAETYRRSLEQYETGLDRIDDGLAAARANRLTESNAAFDAAFAAFGRSDGLLRDYGFHTCAEAKLTWGAPTRAEPEGGAAARAAFITQTDGICRAANDELRPIEASAFDKGIPDLATWGRFLPQAIPIFEKLVADVDALPAPAGDDAELQPMLDAYREALAQAKEASRAAAANDEAAFGAAIDKLVDAARRGDEASERYGFEVCREG